MISHGQMHSNLSDCRLLRNIQRTTTACNAIIAWAVVKHAGTTREGKSSSHLPNTFMSNIVFEQFLFKKINFCADADKLS